MRRRLLPILVVPVIAAVAACGGGDPADPGLRSADGTTLFRAEVEGKTTRVAAIDAASGKELRSLQLPGAFSLPVVTAQGALAGLSRDGELLVLQDPAEPGTRETRLALLGTDFVEPAKILALPGEFSYDALSPDKRLLFLIQHLPPADSNLYNVRVYDLVAGALGAGPIVDKRVAAAGPMQGYPVARVESEDGVVIYTLYQGEDYAFVHVLDTSGGAFCIDFPAGAGTAEAADAWTLRLDTDAPRLYAENAELDIVVAVNTDRLTIASVSGAGAPTQAEALAG